MKKLISVIALLLCCIVLFCACGDSDNVYVPKNVSAKQLGTTTYPTMPKNSEEKTALLLENTLDNEFIATIVDFAYKTGSTLFSGEKSQGYSTNYNYSPVSLYYALSIVANGANGNTQTQLMDYLCAKGFSKEYLATQMSKLYKVLYNSNNDNQIEISNSLWLSKIMPFEEEFINNATLNYYAELFEVDFSASQTANDMSAWVENKTHGKLKPEFETYGDTMMHIINTVYFCSKWELQFNKNLTKEDLFYLYAGATDSLQGINCDFMNMVTDTAIVIGDNYTRISLDFGNGARMNFLLPNEGVDLNSILANGDLLASAFTQGVSRYAEVTISIPKFSFKCKFNQDDFNIANLDAFSPYLADFSGISTVDSFISTLVQETFIEVSEEKVEAAAYTDIEMSVTSVGPTDLDKYEFICNRPFAYTITYNGVTLFMGAVYNPTQT